VGRPVVRSRSTDDNGFVLVLWALALTALAAFFTFAITLGNLVQSGADVQGAADALALAGTQSSGTGIWGPSSTDAPGGLAQEMLTTYGIGEGWQPSHGCVPPPNPQLSPMTASVDASGTVLCIAATTGCAAPQFGCVVWVLLLQPQPSVLFGPTVQRWAMAYMGPGGQALLCDATTCPSS
jgi:hypothetical protein